MKSTARCLFSPFALARHLSLRRAFFIVFMLSINFLVSAQTGIITRQGNTLYRNGSSYKFVGFNAFTLTGCGNSNEVPTDTQLNDYFASLRPNSITRTWAFRNLGIANITRVVNAAAAHGQMLVLVLSDGRSHCGDTDGAPGGDGSGKTPAWYQSGYQTLFRPWITQVVNQFKTSSAVGYWEIINEPDDAGNINTLKAFLDDCAATIKTADPNHLVSTGSWAEWAYGGTDGGKANFKLIHSGPNIDIGTLHEYDYDYANSRTIVSGHYQPCIEAMNELNKVLVVGEMGAVADASGCFSTFQQRADAMKQKYDAYVLNGGARGALVWNWNTATADAGCNMNIKPSDPLIAITHDYVLPGGGGDTQAPSVPTGLSSSNITQTGFTLSWTASTDNVGVTGYEIFRNGTSIGTSATTSFNVTGSTCNTTYSMTVRARDAVPNWSAQSTGLNVTTAACSSIVTVNDAVTGTGQNQFEYVGTWSTSTGTGKYMNDDHFSSTTNSYYNFRFTGTQVQIYAAKASHHGIAGVSIDGGAEVNVDFYAATRVDNVLIWTSPTLPSTSHTLKVRVTGTKNSSSSSYVIPIDRIDFTPGAADTQAPSVPTGLASSGIAQTSFTLSWTASADNVGVTGYEIFRNGTSIGTSATTSFNVTGLACNTSYSITVRARDAVPNWSAQSTPLNVTTAACAATNVALNKTTAASSTQTGGYESSKAVDGNTTTTRWAADFTGDPQWISVSLGGLYSISRVVLRWETAYGKAYQIQVSNDNMNWTNVYSTTTGDGGVDDISFTAVSTRYVRMYGTQRANTAYSYSLWEFEVYGTFQSNAAPSGLHGIESENESAEKTSSLVVYPNPLPHNAGTALNLRLNGWSNEKITVNIRDAAGKTVYSSMHNVSQDKQTLSIPVGKLAAGLYIISAEGLNRNRVQYRKLIVR